jgi:hypothetical protein
MRAGWDGYYDSSAEGADEGMSGYNFMAGATDAFGTLGSINEGQRPLPYVPDLAPVGSGSAYFPRSVADDAVALNVLGFGAGFPGGGVSQSSDMSRAEGAWDSTFQDAVRRFQTAKGLKADGWIGPATRTALGATIVAFNASPAGKPAIVVVTEATRPAPQPPTIELGSGPAPPVDNTIRNVAIAGGVVAAIGIGYLIFTS